MIKFTRPVGTRTILFALIALNFIGIALSEVQRRALTYQGVDAQREFAAKVEALTQAQVELKQVQQRQGRLLVSQNSKIDRIAAAASLLDPQARSPADLSKKRDTIRINQVVILMVALDQYRADHGVFPGPFPDDSIDDLKDALVGGHYLHSMPVDPQNREQLRYTTGGAPDGQRYGLKVWLENGGDCLTGVGYENSGWWGALPSCPF
ncbi:hypothetical protein BSN85_35020 [Bradyrhizobium brasilense]|uniref:hypothetical protein n=1 Tax=Bradyrhizobium brasilense TaxID=1419277 RepID=UPI000975B453|nr:hypothetical protein [Bradyrhizobium brasilense]OMI00026.1 hypothetical protein BSN85_35020 [Bradyrhizobium brasilense]